MLNLTSLAGQVCIVAAGVLLAGILMNLYPKLPIISTALKGFD